MVQIEVIKDAYVDMYCVELVLKICVCVSE